MAAAFQRDDLQKAISHNVKVTFPSIPFTFHLFSLLRIDFGFFLLGFATFIAALYFINSVFFLAFFSTISPSVLSSFSPNHLAHFAAIFCAGSSFQFAANFDRWRRISWPISLSFLSNPPTFRFVFLWFLFWFWFFGLFDQKISDEIFFKKSFTGIVRPFVSFGNWRRLKLGHLKRHFCEFDCIVWSKQFPQHWPSFPTDWLIRSSFDLIDSFVSSFKRFFLEVLAWILTGPWEPTQFEQLDADLFNELEAKQTSVNRRRGCGRETLHFLWLCSF